ncbi:MAG TPA: DUF2400 family protein, partial [Thermoplasmata archaeon]|nr:DUF2400 family protein [Thermoplasmata archaeon]
MTRPHRPTEGFPSHLRALAERFPYERSLAEDPLSCVRPYRRDPRAAEIAGIFASTLAIGNTTSIRRAIGRLEADCGGDLARWVEGIGPKTWRTSVAGFRHRWIRGDQMGYLAYRLHETYATSDSFEEVYRNGRAFAGDFSGGIAAIARALRSPPTGRRTAPPGYDRLFPDPLGRSRSACKRITLFVRWMVRREAPDLGLWTRVDPGELRIPLDQHVYWIAYHLGLTQRKS